MTNVIGAVKQEAQKISPDVDIVLNTVPFGLDDFDNCEDHIFGQRFEALAEVVDVFEVMSYHQILKRSPAWIGAIADEVKSLSGKTVVSTIQVSPLYLDGFHKTQMRNREISINEYHSCLSAAQNSTTNGVIFFTWSDLLKQIYTKNDHRYVDALSEWKK